jgi:hypothetical protein
LNFRPQRGMILSMRQRLEPFLRLRTFPSWVTGPLAFAGLTYFVYYPFGITWPQYGFTLLVVVGLGWYLRRNWLTTTLARTETGAVVWVRKRPRKGKTEESPTYEAPSDLIG